MEKREVQFRAYYRQFRGKYLSGNRSEFHSAVFCGVKYVELVDLKELDYDKTVELFQTIELIQAMMSCMTLRQFMVVFPIDKVYDGERYGCKDYFTVKADLEAYSPDAPMLQNVEDVLCAYAAAPGGHRDYDPGYHKVGKSNKNPPAHRRRKESVLQLFDLWHGKRFFKNGH